MQDINNNTYCMKRKAENIKAGSIKAGSIKALFII